MDSSSNLAVSLVADLSDAKLAQLTRELGHDLSRIGVQARPIEALPAPGQKGEPITLGVLALVLITSGTVKAAIECFKAYLSRERSLSIKLTRANGTLIEITARNVDTSAVQEALEAVASAE
jgi:Effector Associated Constant Component 1